MAAAAEPGGVFRHSFSEGTSGWEVAGTTVEPGEWLGRRCVRLSAGGVLLTPFQIEPPYTMEMTLAGGPGESYVGACFHVQDTQNYEAVYLAPHLGGQIEAIQYDAALNGSMTWQIFSGPDTLAPATLERERWHRLRLDVWPEAARVYVDEPEDGMAPAATFALRTGLTSGRAGIWSYLPCYVEDFSLRPLPQPAPPTGARQPAPSGTVRAWRVGDRVVDAETNGTLCLNRLAAIGDGPLTAACDVVVPEGGHSLALELGYSDHVTVWWDEQLVHEGEWRWNPKGGADGRVRPAHVTVPLPASSAGAHRLRATVEASEPFGWGLTARVLADGAPCEARRAAPSG